MPTLTFKAHYDGERIVLDEPFDLPLDSPLMVTMVVPLEDDHSTWTKFSTQNLSQAYSDAEPDYTIRDVKGR